MPGLIYLATEAGLRAACADIGSSERWTEDDQQWLARLARMLQWVRESNEQQRADYNFQFRLWEENDVAAVGQGNIAMRAALRDDGFRLRFAARSMESLPTTWEERSQFLTRLYEALKEELRPFLDGKVPHLKIFRVIAALYPESMTSVAASGMLYKLAQAMGAPRGVPPVDRHIWVRRRIDTVLGPADTSANALAERMSLPWQLYARFVRPPVEAAEAPPSNSPPKLVPLPAARRRHGLTGIKGLFPAMLSTLEFVRDGVTREALLDFLRASSPNAKATSLGVTINALQSEFGVIRTEDSLYVLTERGQSVLDSQDASELADWLLTRVLGVDKAIVELRDRGPLTRVELIEAIRSMNPALGSDYGAQALIGWLRSLEVIGRDPRDKDRLALTTVGQDWAVRIDWQPEALRAADDDVDDEINLTLLPHTAVTAAADAPLTLPTFSTIIASIQATGHHFPASLIARLHASLWSHSRRHFAILTGLSGAGKTLLARSYAQALIADGGAHQRLTLPVQPGWYDPGALLGYINPLQVESYVRPPFLEFLLAAAADTAHPYVAILDEMNLSHPEHYMAPLLSAMETGDPIPLHTEDEFFDGVPRSIPYPPNVVLIGTVNMDETTHGLSDKVLDRAFVLEFWHLDLDQYPRWNTRSLAAEHERQTREVLGGLLAALAPARLHFGWRVVDDVLDYLALAATAGEALPFETALDSVIYAKVLPKLRGEDAPRFRDALSACEAAFARFTVPLAASRAKIADLQRDLESTGSARFWR
jgi:5-methylcytosine-specific restriction protein B